jgi:predicted small lipoprotein YifL
MHAFAWFAGRSPVVALLVAIASSAAACGRQGPPPPAREVSAAPARREEPRIPRGPPEEGIAVAIVDDTSGSMAESVADAQGGRQAKLFEPLRNLGVTVVEAADERTLDDQLGFIFERKILLEDEDPAAPAAPAGK